jgi:D-glycero-D-manno-heptose 1,7-bisphosphate phosphatase
MLKPAAFLDRDGVINKDKKYLYKISDFEWIEGAKESIKYLNENGYYVFVVTNQSGIAKSY